MENSEKKPLQTEQTDSQKETQDLLSKSKKLKESHQELTTRMNKSAKDISDFLGKDKDKK